MYIIGFNAIFSANLKNKQLKMIRLIVISVVNYFDIYLIDNYLI